MKRWLLTGAGVLLLSFLGATAYATLQAHNSLDDIEDTLGKTGEKLASHGDVLETTANQGQVGTLEARIVELETLNDILSERVLELESAAADPFVARVRAALLADPAMLFDAVEAYETQQAAAQVSAYAEDLNGDPYVPVLGNPDGDITVVEFFDYNCGYCRRAMDDVLSLVAEDGNIRLILKEFPVLSEQSQEAAIVALAATAYVDYNELHQMGMTTGGTVDGDVMLQNAELLGADMDALRTDLEAQRGAYVAALFRTQQMGQVLGVSGTPAFYIEGTVIPGAVGKAELARTIAAIRAAREGS